MLLGGFTDNQCHFLIIVLKWTVNDILSEVSLKKWVMSYSQYLLNPFQTMRKIPSLQHKSVLKERPQWKIIYMNFVNSAFKDEKHQFNLYFIHLNSFFKICIHWQATISIH